MSEHVVNIGARVTSQEGKHLGKVEKLIVHPSTQTVDGFLLSKGHFSAPKIVEASQVAATGPDGIVLKLSATEAEKLPNLVEEQLLRAPGYLTYELPLGGFVDVAGSGDKWVLRGSAGGDYPHTGTAPLFFEAPIGNVEAQNISNLPEDSLLISEGTDVIGSDGKKIGKVDELIVDDERRVTAILVKAGWLFKHDVTIPVSAIMGAAHDHVRLNITADQAKQATVDPQSS
jgi:uncharacterized protein YrrD